MDVKEFKRWMAFDMLSNEEIHTQLTKAIQHEDMLNMTAQESADAILSLFKSFGKN